MRMCNVEKCVSLVRQSIRQETFYKALAAHTSRAPPPRLEAQRVEYRV